MCETYFQQHVKYYIYLIQNLLEKFALLILRSNFLYYLDTIELFLSILRENLL